MVTNIHWKKVLTFSHAIDDSLILNLMQLTKMHGWRAISFEYGSTTQVVLLPFDMLFQLAQQDKTSLEIESISDQIVASNDSILFVSTGSDPQCIGSLFIVLTDNTFGSRLPELVGVQKTPVLNAVLLSQLESVRAKKLDSSLVFRLSSDQQLVVDLYRTGPMPEESKQTLRRGLDGLQETLENTDNLDQRSKWFKRRSGK